MFTGTLFRRFLLAVALMLLCCSAANAGYTRSNDPHGYPPHCGCSGRGAGGSSGGTGGAAGGTGGGAGGGATSPTPGMPVYSISPMLISLSMHDTPLSYAPPVGRPMAFTLSYNQLDIDQPATFNYGNVGPKWTDNWLGYVQDDPASLGSKTLVYLPSGPGRLYHGFNTSNGTFAPEAETGAQLVLVSTSPVTYERRFPDGSKDVFAASDHSTSYPRRVFLTQRVDAYGNAETLSYDEQNRLTQVSDAERHTLTFHYDNANQPLKLTRVDDSFGRSIALTYDSSGRLASITDAIGMTSSFGYDSGTNITSLTTPYGTTTFATHQSGVRRWIDTTDADGNTSRMEFNEAVSGVPFSTSKVPQGIHAFNRYLNSRDSFFWDASAFKQAEGDYSKAVIYHWNHKTSGGRLSSVTADALESIKYPLENRIWYDHPGDISGGSGTLNMPSAIARVLPDGSTQLTQNTYDIFGKLTRSINPTGLETDYTYAPNHIDVVRIDRHGADGSHTTETFTYNDQHNVLSHTDETGATTHFTYNAVGQLLTKTDPLGHTTTHSYDAHGDLTSTTDGNGHATHFTYDAQGRRISQIDPLGRTTHYQYDALNRIVRTTYPDGSYQAVTWNKLDKAKVRDRDGDVTTYTYDGLRHRTSMTDPLGDTTKYTYYANGLLHTRTDPNGHTTAWQRDLEGRVTAVTDAAGATTHFAYDLADRRHSVSNALNQTTSYAYDAMDRRVRKIDPNGIITASTYTPRGWLTTRTVRANADGSASSEDATTTFGYNSSGDITAVTDADGITTQYDYDAAHRLSAIDDVRGNTRIFMRDAVGNLTSVFDAPSGSSTPSYVHSYAYDAANERTSSIDAQGRVTTYSYDANGRLRDTRDPLGIHTVTTFDPLGLLMRKERGLHDDQQDSADTATTQYTYDAAHRLTSVIDPSALTTHYHYDPAGQVTEKISPDTGTTQYTYDATGNRITHTDARGVTSTNTYDALNRITSTAYPDANQNVVYVYDNTLDPYGNTTTSRCSTSAAIGHLREVLEVGTDKQYCYDDRGNVISTVEFVRGAPYQTNYVYDGADRLMTMTTPDSSVIKYSYDKAGRLAGVNVQASGAGSGASGMAVSGITYLPFGPITGYTLGNGQHVSRNYDDNYRLTDLISPAVSLHLARDAMGNVVGIDNNAGPTPVSETYHYDSLYRLDAVTEGDGTSLESYTYDKTGDRLSKTATHSVIGAGTYNYTPGTHQLASIGNGLRSNDANGNTTASVMGGNTYTFTYDDRGRMTAALRNGPTGVGYINNALGQRVAKLFPPGSKMYEEHYIYDQKGHLLAEYGDTNRVYVRAGDMPVAVIDKTTDNSAGSTTINYITADQLNTPRAVSNAAGKTIWSWAYQGNPFGEQQPTSTTGYVLNLRYPGQYYDAETNTNYNDFRNYEPATGRYLQSDPIGLVGGISTYAYVGNNPITRIDPLGLIWVTIGTNYHWGQDVARWWYNRQSRQIGNGYELNMPGANPKEWVGTKRDLIQQWQHDPKHPGRDCEHKMGQKRTIPQDFGSIYDSWQGKDIYTWLPVVASPTYNNY